MSTYQHLDRLSTLPVADGDLIQHVSLVPPCWPGHVKLATLWIIFQGAAFGGAIGYIPLQDTSTRMTGRKFYPFIVITHFNQRVDTNGAGYNRDQHGAARQGHRIQRLNQHTLNVLRHGRHFRCSIQTLLVDGAVAVRDAIRWDFHRPCQPLARWLSRQLQGFSSNDHRLLLDNTKRLWRRNDSTEYRQVVRHLPAHGLQALLARQQPVVQKTLGSTGVQCLAESFE
ncbi:WD40 repeat protein [Pseudomonas syringae pv. actinidiae]|uniref:WD40 repeat protein n=1 Tax=Pseudomonas syringae pv. actinidiae TaxID=103796 RepID=A0A2V0QE12_PSESF|nr:WD40 repeat protein [Pseudomonas syringae pv. actinidiae]